MEYAMVLRELTADEGGGWLAEVSDLPGCMGDGETGQEAIDDALNAIGEWIAEAEATGRTVPQPNGIENYSGKFLQRVPKSVHMKLTAQARREGVSLNSFVTMLIAEGLGRKNSHAA